MVRGKCYTFLESPMSQIVHFFFVFLWADVHFTNQNRTDPKNRKVLITQKLYTISWPSFSQSMSIWRKTFLKSFKYLWRHTNNLQTGTSVLILICKIWFNGQNCLNLCMIEELCISHDLRKFYWNRANRSKFICWSGNYQCLESQKP